VVDGNGVVSVELYEQQSALGNMDPPAYTRVKISADG
jgi:hypothetical protein